MAADDIALDHNELDHGTLDHGALSGLAAELHGSDAALPAEWPAIFPVFRAWVAQPDLRTTLRRYLEALTADSAEAIAARSRETTTHFAWCLRDRPGEPYSFWLHEYKPQRDWRQGYADSVHNHRYHFCTTLLRGEYVHERHLVAIDPATGLISSTTPERTARCRAGDAGYLLATDFHRIPLATDGTLTFLVKSRPVATSSLSYDPNTGTSHLHVPVESRLSDLASSL